MKHINDLLAKRQITVYKTQHTCRKTKRKQTPSQPKCALQVLADNAPRGTFRVVLK